MAKQKIAVLGGGVGSLVAAFEITEQTGWQDRYELTVYQLGWRLGGKGASGRNQAIHDRIQEHGLHLWMGFYENAFDMIRRAYDYCRENNLTPGTPFPSYRDAFKPMNFTAVAEQYPPDSWQVWPVFWPPNDEMPGDPDGADNPRAFDPMSPWGYAKMVLEWVREHVDRVTLDQNFLHGLLSDLCGDALLFAEHAGDCLQNNTILHRIERFALATAAHESTSHDAIADALEWFRTKFFSCVEGLLDANTDIRRAVTVIDTGIAIVIGMIRDGVLEQGFDAIEQYDFIEWLGNNGCVYAASPLTISMYDACFGYADGNPETRNMAAGSTLYGALRLMFTYRGALMWWMEAGMGDTIFTPIYKALEARGVKFEFFNKVTELKLTPDGRSVGSIEIDVQAKAKPELSGGYSPLIDVKGLLSWPSLPLYNQLVNGDVLQNETYKNRDLESWWSDLPVLEKKTLKLGEDFHRVLLGISLGALPYICPTFPEADRTGRWGQMLDHVKVVRTQALQLWLKKSAEQMGWAYFANEAPVMCGFVEPHDTWAQMDHLIPRESWSPEECAQIAYFCNTAPNDADQAPFSDSTYPARQLEKTSRIAQAFLELHASTIWANGLQWTDLVGYDGSAGNPLASQFVRINVDPSEQYVLSLAGSTKYRLSSGDSGFENLVLAGDWTLVDVNLGCVEAAVQSGKMASFALTGAPDSIFGAFRQKLPLARSAHA